MNLSAKTFIRRTTTIAAASILIASGSGTVFARDFTIASWGGGYQDSQRKNFFKPFANDQKIKVLEDTYLGGWAQFKAMQETNNWPWDVVQIETSELVRGCEEGMFVKLDWSRIAPKDSIVPPAVTECGLGVVGVSQLVVWNPKNTKVQPTSIADFFDLEKIPGKRGLRSDPKGTLEFALMADGVDVKDVYKVIGTKEGLDRAFAKLDSIKDSIQWWEAGAQAPEWLASGDVVMSTAYNGRISKANKDGIGLKMLWQNNILYVDKWVIFANSKHVELGYKYLKSYTDAKAQAAFTDDYTYGPTTKAAMKFVKPDVAAQLPAGDNIKDALDTGSPESVEFWLDNSDEIFERWTAWKAK
ncbi:MAG: ABC transporter substrate-binding protein [Gammaproteobacteria bacterium]|nr:ABC transporter substrate-binding protein [Gammaproteobacteria bacterium]